MLPGLEPVLPCCEPPGCGSPPCEGEGSPALWPDDELLPDADPGLPPAGDDEPGLPPADDVEPGMPPLEDEDVPAELPLDDDEPGVPPDDPCEPPPAGDDAPCEPLDGLPDEPPPELDELLDGELGLGAPPDGLGIGGGDVHAPMAKPASATISSRVVCLFMANLARIPISCQRRR